MMKTELSELHVRNTSQLGNHANKNIDIRIVRHELETETDTEDGAQTSNILHPFDSSELDGRTIKVENYNSSESLVKTELVEYYGNTSTTEISNPNPNHWQTVVTLETIPKTETRILSDVSSGPSSDEDEDHVCNIDPYSNCGSSSDPEPERDPFGDVHCDPSFSQRQQPHNNNDLNKSSTQADGEEANGGAQVGHSSNLKSSPKITGQPEALLNSKLQCQLCLQIQTSASELKTHLKICAASHKSRRRFCVPCNKLLCTTQSYRKHARKRHGVEVALVFKKHWLHCQLCPSSFPGKKYFMAHLDSHHGSTKTDGDGLELKPYRCQECPSSFAYVGGLTNHVQKHNPEVFKCHESNCEAAFKQEYRLRLHLQRVHSEDRPFKCEEPNCGKAFKRKDVLKNHMVCHTRVRRRLGCSHPGCDRSFKNKNGVRQHLKHHTVPRQLENVTNSGQLDSVTGQTATTLV